MKCCSTRNCFGPSPVLDYDIDKDVSASKLVIFADDTRLYSGVRDVTDCDNLQLDLNAVLCI